MGVLQEKDELQVIKEININIKDGQGYSFLSDIGIKGGNKNSTTYCIKIPKLLIDNKLLGLGKALKVYIVPIS